MKTDDLIDVLNENIEPVDPRYVRRVLIAAVLAGLLVACGSAFFVLGVRADLREQNAIVYLVGKITFTLASATFAAVYLIKCSRPGGERQVKMAVIATPFLAIVMLAATSLANAPPSHWTRMILGEQWLECLVSIPVIAITPFALVMWAVREAAPTDLRRTGALAGLLAGAISATGYALHCTDDSLPFLAFWYGGTIAICALTGAILGPRLLRW